MRSCIKVESAASLGRGKGNMYEGQGYYYSEACGGIRSRQARRRLDREARRVTSFNGIRNGKLDRGAAVEAAT